MSYSRGVLRGENGGKKQRMHLFHECGMAVDGVAVMELLFKGRAGLLEVWKNAKAMPKPKPRAKRSAKRPAPPLVQ